MKGFATTACHHALFVRSSFSDPMKGLRSWRRTAVRLRLFDALLFFRTVLFDIAAENPPDNLFGLTQNATFGKEIHRRLKDFLCTQPEVPDWCGCGMPALPQS
jgi:hypothetical protein